MSRIRDIKTERNRQKKEKSRSKIMLRVGIMFSIFVLILIYWAMKDIPVFKIVQTNIRLSKMEGNFPRKNEDITKYDIFEIDGYIGLVTNTRFYFYSQEGKELTSFLHGIENPQWMVVGRELIYYDIGGKNVYKYNIYGELETFPCDGKIIFAKMSKEGYLATAYISQRGSTRLDVLFSGNKFKWSSGVDGSHLADVFFSPSGRFICVESLNAEGGRLKTTFETYSLYADKPELVYESFNSIAYDYIADFPERNAALTNEGFVFFDQKGEKTAEYLFDKGELLAYDLNTAFPYIFVLKDNIDNSKEYLLALDTTLSEMFALEFSGGINDFYVQGGTIYILADDRVYWYNKNGERQGEVLAPENSISFIVLKNNAYVLGISAIEKIPLTARGSTPTGLSEEAEESEEEQI